MLKRNSPLVINIRNENLTSREKKKTLPYKAQMSGATNSFRFSPLACRRDHSEGGSKISSQINCLHNYQPASFLTYCLVKDVHVMDGTMCTSSIKKSQLKGVCELFLVLKWLWRADRYIDRLASIKSMAKGMPYLDYLKNPLKIIKIYGQIHLISPYLCSPAKYFMLSKGMKPKV